MDSKLQIFFIIAIVVYLLIIIHLLKKKKLNLKYTLLWIIATFILLVVTIFPNTVYFISRLIGIGTPINSAVVLAGMFVFVILIVLHLLFQVLTQTVRILTQKIGLIRKTN